MLFCLTTTASFFRSQGRREQGSCKLECFNAYYTKDSQMKTCNISKLIEFKTSTTFASFFTQSPWRTIQMFQRFGITRIPLGKKNLLAVTGPLMHCLFTFSSGLKHLTPIASLELRWTSEHDGTIWSADAWLIPVGAAILSTFVQRFPLMKAFTAAMVSGVTVRWAYPGLVESIGELAPLWSFLVHS